MPRGAASGKLISGRNRADEIGFNYPACAFLAQSIARNEREPRAFRAREVNYVFVRIPFPHTDNSVHIRLPAAVAWLKPVWARRSPAVDGDGVARLQF